MTGFLPGLIITLPFLAAVLIRIPVITRSRHAVDGISLLTSLATAILAIKACLVGVNEPIIQWIGGWEPRDGVAVGIVLVADGFSAGFVALTASLVAAVFLYMGSSYEAKGSILHMFTLLFLGALAGFVLVGDLLTMFVFMELMAISSYIITAFKTQDKAPVQAGFNIGVIGTVGAFIFLLGGGMVYRIVGTPNIAEAAARITDMPMTPELALAFALLMTGLGVKCGFLTYHFAHIDSHAVAPAPQAGLFGAIFVQAGLYGFARILSILFDAPVINMDAFMVFLVAGGVATALTGAIMSLVQEHFKRLLAFSSIAHLGIASVGVGFLHADGLSGAGLYVFSHAMVKLALFLGAGVLLHQFNVVNRGPVKGDKREMLPVVIILVLGAMALAGAPPSGLYGGKTLIEQAASEVNMSWIIIPLYAAAAITGAAVIRFVCCLYHPMTKYDPDEPLVHEGSKETTREGGNIVMTLIPAMLLGAGFLVALVPQVVQGIDKAALNDFDSIRYISLVLKGEAEQPVDKAAHDLWKINSVVKGLLSAIAAFVVGVVTSRLTGFGDYAEGPFKWLRQLHTGHVGDYVTWLMLGTGVTIAWLMFWL